MMGVPDNNTNLTSLALTILLYIFIAILEPLAILLIKLCTSSTIINELSKGLSPISFIIFIVIPL